MFVTASLDGREHIPLNVIELVGGYRLPELTLAYRHRPLVPVFAVVEPRVDHCLHGLDIEEASFTQELRHAGVRSERTLTPGGAGVLDPLGGPCLQDGIDGIGPSIVVGSEGGDAHASSVTEELTPCPQGR